MRLLDAAEKLFGARGYEAVGMRELTKAANVNLGAATYHFGSKQALYCEAFMRRFRPVMDERVRLLRDAERAAKGRPLPVKTIVDCMVRPPYLHGLDHPHFHPFLARNMVSPPPFLGQLLFREVEPNIGVFIMALQRSLPHLTADLIRLRELLSMGGLLMLSVRMGKAPGPRDRKREEGMVKELVCFISAGLRSAAAVTSAERPALPTPPKARST